MKNLTSQLFKKLHIDGSRIASLKQFNFYNSLVNEQGLGGIFLNKDDYEDLKVQDNSNILLNLVSEENTEPFIFHEIEGIFKPLLKEAFKKIIIPLDPLWVIKKQYTEIEKFLQKTKENYCNEILGIGYDISWFSITGEYSVISCLLESYGFGAFIFDWSHSLDETNLEPWLMTEGCNSTDLPFLAKNIDSLFFQESEFVQMALRGLIMRPEEVRELSTSM